jgi:hypothetical protein
LHVTKNKILKLTDHTRPTDSYSLDMDQVCGVLGLYRTNTNQVWAGLCW